MIGFLYVMHGLLMPDNPVLARLPARVDESGFAPGRLPPGPSDGQPVRYPPRTRDVSGPEIAALAAWLEAPLAEQADTGLGLLRLPGVQEASGR
ncbi:hypothetical protein DDV98_36495 [Streptomyces sp. IB2014 011-12]|nr:hypothetical protein STIB_70000 [Streptomyces sp. IB2014 011-1]RDV46475.1 hypothetical protein DDV98_36495 [Streptomyces sp. IB2014 011-12]